MNRPAGSRRSVLMLVSSMLIFGTLGVFRRDSSAPDASGAFFHSSFLAKGDTEGSRCPSRNMEN